VSMVTCLGCLWSRALGVYGHVPWVSMVTCLGCLWSRALGVYGHVPWVSMVQRMRACALHTQTHFALDIPVHMFGYRRRSGFAQRVRGRGHPPTPAPLLSRIVHLHLHWPLCCCCWWWCVCVCIHGVFRSTNTYTPNI
jgi:hypothetical protein